MNDVLGFLKESNLIKLYHVNFLALQLQSLPG